ncbi:hypothetical protein H0H93_008920 [Arthromyces matolae]|nr:hypothetical protein H0H93_008920 [Arthromyces matolae]
MPEYTAAPIGNIDHRGYQALHSMLYGQSSECIRFSLTLFNDGRGVRCGEVVGAYKCSRCTAQAEKRVTTSQPSLSAFHVLTRPSTSGFASQPVNAVTVPTPSMASTSVLSKRKLSRATASSSTLVTQMMENAKRSRSGSVTPALTISTSNVSGFERAMEQVKEKKIARSMAVDKYTSNFLDALACWAGICVVCQIAGKTSTKHDIVYCETLNHGMEDASITEYKRFRSEIQYRLLEHGTVCYCCHIPQLNDVLHRTFQRGAQSCEPERKDIIAPIAYCAWYYEDIRNKAMAHFKVNWRTFEEFGAWLRGPPRHGHKTNMVALFLWFTELVRPE